MNVFISESKRKVGDFQHGIIKTKKGEAESRKPAAQLVAQDLF